MTLYLLVLSDTDRDSYSLWKTEQAAKSERKYIMDKFGYNIYAFEIIQIDIND